ncbi:MAG: HEAT repeat domain-containing protein [Planctomycetes bacterium]|nr:HEAT repeat domain-containing protein [Planctomycetota bacterium]
MKILVTTLVFSVAMIGSETKALAVPAPAPLDKLVPEAEWIVIGELGPLRPAAPNDKMARHGDIIVKEVLKGPPRTKKPQRLTLFTLDPKLLKTRDAPVGVIMYEPGISGIWLLEPLEDGVYQARNPNSFLPLKQRAEVERELPIGKPAPPAKGLSAVLVVAPDGTGDHRTLGEAIASLKEGGEIRIRPGVYRETLEVDKSLTLVGDGPLEKIVIQSKSGDCLLLEAKKATIKHLTLQCVAGADKEFYAIDVAAGEVTIEDCDLSSKSLACVGVHGKDTRVVIRQCRIHDGNDAGVFVYEDGYAEVDGSEIFGNLKGNVVVWAGAEVQMRKCLLHSSPDVGLDVRKGGRATLVDCQINRNKGGQLSIARKARVTFERCLIDEGQAKEAGNKTEKPLQKKRDLVAIIKVLEDPQASDDQLNRAIFELGPGDKEAVAAIQAMLSSRDPGRRSHGIHAANAVGAVAEPVVPSLIKILREDENFVRQSGAAAAIASTGTSDADAIKALSAALQDDSAIVREVAAGALLKIGPPAAKNAIADLKRCRKDIERRVRATAIAAEAVITGEPEALKEVIVALPGFVGSMILYDLSLTIGIAGASHPDAIAALEVFTEVLNDDKAPGREGVAFALARLDPKTTVPASAMLEKALHDKEPMIRWYAATALLRQKSDHVAAAKAFTAVLTEVVSYHQQNLGEKNYPLRFQRGFFSAICGSHPGLSAEAVPLLRRISKEAPDEASRQIAAQALTKFKE